MAALLEFADDLRQENPYAAPQTRELVLPLALAQAEARATPTAEILPRSSELWMNAARVVYLFSFVVPIVTSDMTMPFAGGIMFCMGIVLCWHPFGFPWWANVLLVLSQRNLHRGNSRRGLLYAGLAVVAALLWIAIDGVVFSGKTMISPPYLCWVAAMLLQWIAAVEMRGLNKQQGHTSGFDQPRGRQVRPRDLL